VGDQSIVRLGANVSYLDSHYAAFPNAPIQVLQAYCSGPAGKQAGQAADMFFHTAGGSRIQCRPFANLSGQATAFAPRWSGKHNATYSTSIRDFQFTRN